MCTSPQEHLSCMVYSVFRCPLPCNPFAAHNMYISHRRLRTLPYSLPVPSTKYEHPNAHRFVLPLHRRLNIYLCTDITWTNAQRCVRFSVQYINSVCVLHLKNTFPIWCTPCLGVHCRLTRPQRTCAFLIAA